MAEFLASFAEGYFCSSCALNCCSPAAQEQCWKLELLGAGRHQPAGLWGRTINKERNFLFQTKLTRILVSIFFHIQPVERGDLRKNNRHLLSNPAHLGAVTCAVISLLPGCSSCSWLAQQSCCKASSALEEDSCKMQKHRLCFMCTGFASAFNYYYFPFFLAHVCFCRLLTSDFPLFVEAGSCYIYAHLRRKKINMASC